jgi:hypothetical protein
VDSRLQQLLLLETVPKRSIPGLSAKCKAADAVRCDVAPACQQHLQHHWCCQQVLLQWAEGGPEQAMVPAIAWSCVMSCLVVTHNMT